MELFAVSALSLFIIAFLISLTIQAITIERTITDMTTYTEQWVKLFFKNIQKKG